MADNLTGRTELKWMRYHGPEGFMGDYVLDLGELAGQRSFAVVDETGRYEGPLLTESRGASYFLAEADVSEEELTEERVTIPGDAEIVDLSDFAA